MKKKRKPPEIKIFPLPFNSSRWLILIFALAVAAYLPTFINGFTNWDDIDQVTGNLDVQAAKFSLKKIFSSFYVGMYQPLTTLFFSLIYKMGKLHAVWYHTWSLLLHLLNIFLVYTLLNKISGKKTIAIITSLFFALSPMQVEAVAWVSATGTVLFTSFYLASAIVYLLYNETASKKKYVISIILFLFALLSKSAAVTLPLLLLLFDYYRGGTIRKKDLITKIPFFILSIVFGIITIYARQKAGHIIDISKYFSIYDRPFLIMYSLVYYILNNIIPFKLSAFHLYPAGTGHFLPARYYIYSSLLLLIIFIIYKAKSLRKDLLFGFLFFFLTIFVMIEIVPVGIQVVKERYTYISCIGIYFVISMLLVRLSEKDDVQKAVTVLVIAAALGFGYTSFSRVKIWKDSYTLWGDVLKKQPDCSSAYINRGNAYVVDEKYNEAISDYNEAIELEPAAADAYIDRAIAKSKQDDINGAIEDYDKAIEIGPADAEMYSERALLKIQIQNVAGAIKDFSSAISLDPSDEIYYNQRGVMYGINGKYYDAIGDFDKAIKLKADYADAYSNRGYAEINLSQNEKAITDLTYSIKLNPYKDRTYYLRGVAYEQSNKKEEACADFEKAYELGLTAASDKIKEVCK